MTKLGCIKKLLECSRLWIKQKISQLIDLARPVRKLNVDNVWDSNLIPPRAARDLPTEMIKSQVKHAIVTPVQRGLLKIFHCIFMVVQFNPVVPSQTIQGVN